MYQKKPRCFTHFPFLIHITKHKDTILFMMISKKPQRQQNLKSNNNNNSNTDSRLQIKKFNPVVLSDKIASDASPVICIIGKRNTGKSEVIRSLLYYNKNIPSGIVISPTEMGNKFYGSFCPDSFIHHHFDPELLGRIMTRQRRHVSKYGKIFKNNLFMILDDCMYDSKEVCGNKHIKEIFRNGRHFQITIVVTAQYVMDLPVALRSNIDYVFCMRENNVANIERLYRSFFGIFPTKYSFSQAFSTVTENYGSIVCDNLSRSNKIDECVYWFRALYPCPAFRMGSAKYWNFHNNFYDNNHQSHDNDDDDKTQVNSDIPLLIS